MAGGPELGRWIRDDHTDSSGASSEIVKTKLSPPSPRIEEVPRPELLELLDAGSVRKLTLIGAPAGYGKTTLLSQWRRSQEPDLPFAWVSLDEQDNDPIRLWKRSFKPRLKRAGLPQMRFHDLRHTCATIRFMKGQHPKRVQDTSYALLTRGLRRQESRIP